MIELDLNQRNTQPYSDIGLIKTTWSDGSSSLGTCSLVGRNDILTAGHCVFNPDEGGWATGFEFYFGVDYNATTGSFDSWVSNPAFSQWSANAWTSQIYTDDNNQTMLQSEAQFDVALIGIDTPIGDQLGWLGLAPSYNGNQSAIAVGYPSGSTGMMLESAAVSSNWAYGIYESFIEVMGPGSSGGPLLVDNNIIGVKSTGKWWADLGNDFIYDTLVAELTENNSLLSDSLAPIVFGYSPLDGAHAVAISSNIDLTFSEAIQKGIGTIAIHSGSAGGAIVESFDAATSNRLVFSGSSLTIDPITDLANNTQYFVTFAAGSVKDLAGNSYAGTTTYDFTTAPAPDTAAPTVTSFNPTDGATAVAIASNIALTFSEAIQKGTGMIAFHAGSANGAIVESFDAATSTRLVFSGSSLTIDPVADLTNNTQYFVTFAAGSIKDLAGNNYAGTTTYDFITAVATNVTDGTVGNDKLVGTNASDILNGGKGADSMKGGLGSDIYFVDNKGDTVFESKNAGTDTVNSSISFILGANVENLTLTGKTVINGTGNALNNSLLGNAAANKLSGLAGNDILNGGLGKDSFTGGMGKDVFDFNAVLEIGKKTKGDLITDFSHKQDKIDLFDIDANPGNARDTNDAFKYIGEKAFTGKAGEIHFIKGVLSGDTNGDKVADFDLSITLVGCNTLVIADFVL